MPETTVDVTALYAALDAKRQEKGYSWREVARTLGISPSTLTRMAQGRRPDVDAFATLLRWLAMSADAFMRPIKKKPEEANAVAMISSYLRADRNFEPKVAEALEEIDARSFILLYANVRPPPRPPLPTPIQAAHDTMASLRLRLDVLQSLLPRDTMSDDYVNAASLCYMDILRLVSDLGANVIGDCISRTRAFYVSP